MIVKLLTEQHLEFLSLQGGCRDSTESTLVKIPNCWKSHALAHLEFLSLKGGCTSSSSESTLEKKIPHCSKSHVVVLCCWDSEETVLLSTQNIMLKFMSKKIITSLL